MMMTAIQTPRLTLQLLTPEQAALYFAGNNLLEQHLQLPDAERVVDEHFREVAETLFLPKLSEDPSNILFYSYFIFLEKATRQIAGEIGCHGLPDENGEIEIGYSTQARHQHKGFMREAVGAFCAFYLSLNNVRSIVAETDKTNVASQKVLTHNGFLPAEERTDTLLWRLNASAISSIPASQKLC